jgi:hypothetical protein
LLPVPEASRHLNLRAFAPRHPASEIIKRRITQSLDHLAHPITHGSDKPSGTSIPQPALRILSATQISVKIPDPCGESSELAIKPTSQTIRCCFPASPGKFPEDLTREFRCSLLKLLNNWAPVCAERARFQLYSVFFPGLQGIPDSETRSYVTASTTTHSRATGDFPKPRKWARFGGIVRGHAVSAKRQSDL